MLRDAAAHVDDGARAAAVAEALAALAALPKRARVRAARKLDLARITTDLGVLAVPLLRALIDDDDARVAVGDAVVNVWLELDAIGCANHATTRLDEWEAPTALRVLTFLDASEAYEILAPRVQGDVGMRRFIVDAGNEAARAFVDVRWVDLALRLLPVDGEAAVGLLRLNGSSRADEELDGILDRAVAIDDVVLATLEAIEAGTGSLDHDEVRPRFLATLARFLASPGAEGIESSRFSFSVSIAARELMPHVEGKATAQGRINACRRTYPLIIRG